MQIDYQKTKMDRRLKTEKSDGFGKRTREEMENWRWSLVVDVKGNGDAFGARFEPVESSFLVDHHERHFRGRKWSRNQHESRHGGDQKLSYGDGHGLWSSKLLLLGRCETDLRLISSACKPSDDDIAPLTLTQKQKVNVGPNCSFSPDNGPTQKRPIVIIKFILGSKSGAACYKR